MSELIANLRKQAVDLSKDGAYGIAVSGESDGEIQADFASVDEIFYAWLLVNADNVTDWVIAHNGAILHEQFSAPTPYADYPGGAAQYAADVALLREPIVIDYDPIEPYTGDLDAEELAGLYIEYTEAATRFTTWALARLKAKS